MKLFGEFSRIYYKRTNKCRRGGQELAVKVEKSMISELLDEYADMVIRIAYQNMKNYMDAEDVCQDVFIKLVEKERSFDSEEHIKAWLIRVTINVCKDYLKSGWFKKKAEYNGNEYGYLEARDDVLEEVMNLPVKYRNVIYLHYYEGYSVEEIGEIIGRNKNTVKTWLKRGRNELKLNITGGEI